MKLLYKPIGIASGILAGLLSKRIFAALWRMVDRESPPPPDLRETSTSKVVFAAALEGATQRATRVAVDRAGARAFEHLVGVWPGSRAGDKT